MKSFLPQIFMSNNRKNDIGCRFLIRFDLKDWGKRLRTLIKTLIFAIFFCFLSVRFDICNFRSALHQIDQALQEYTKIFVRSERQVWDVPGKLDYINFDVLKSHIRRHRYFLINYLKILIYRKYFSPNS